MGLIDLVRNIDSHTKTELLGPETTKILRLSFSKNQFDALEDLILNEALILQKGVDLVQNRTLRKKIIDCIKKETLNSLGMHSYDEAEIKFQDIKQFAKAFNIEKEFLLEKPIDDRKSIEVIVPKHNDLINISAYPHDYQKALKDKILKRLLRNVREKILASLPTGAGKTVLAMELIVDLMRTSNALQDKSINLLWIVSSKELSEQSLQSFKKIWNQKGDHSVLCQRFFGKFDTLDHSRNSTITFATFDLMVSRLESSNALKLLESIDYLIIDEAHHSDAYTYEKVILKYQMLNSNFNILGLTATPFRSEDSEFLHFKQNFNCLEQLTDNKNHVISSPIQHLIDREFLSKIKYKILNNSEGKVTESEYYRTLNNAVLNECKLLKERNENTIIFAKSKSHAIALSVFLKKEGFNNGLIIGETPDIVRKQLLGDFGKKENELNILINHLILSTGIDVPGMNSIMVLSDINSPSLGLQILGRAMRGPKNGGNLENTVYLTKQNYDRLSDYKLLEKIVLN